MDIIFQGQKIRGLWSGSTYTVIRRLGQGGVGAAYLVSRDGRLCCLKASDNMASLTWEYKFIKENRKKFLPQVYEIDDFILNNKIKHYIILEYIEGENLSEVTKARPVNERMAAGIVLLVTEIFIEFYRMGYIYTDLKPENIMLDVKNGSLRLIDLGSLVKVDGMVREYTQIYDRAYWNCGPRRADEGYAAFEIMMFAINIINPIAPNLIKGQDVAAILKELPRYVSRDLYNLTEKAFKGRTDLYDIRDALIKICMSANNTNSGKVDFCINFLLAAGLIFLTGVILYGF